MSLINSLCDLSALPDAWLDCPINDLIPLNDDMPFDWAEFVHKLGHKLGKTNQEKCDAYLSGFPESFDRQIELIYNTIDNYLLYRRCCQTFISYFIHFNITFQACFR